MMEVKRMKINCQSRNLVGLEEVWIHYGEVFIFSIRGQDAGELKWL